MEHIEIKKLRKMVKIELDSKRYAHSIGVAYTACSLAMRYEEDLKKAEIAGLLHDCAKNIEHKKKIEICVNQQLPISEIELSNPSLLHAKVGAYLAKAKYKIQDDDILNAILYHNTGRAQMSLLEKIIYVADYIEPNRKHTKALSKIRKEAFQNLNQTMVLIFEDTLHCLKEKNNLIDEVTEDAYQYYVKMMNKEKRIC